MPGNLPAPREHRRKSIRAPPSSPITTTAPVPSGPGEAITGPQTPLNRSMKGGDRVMLQGWRRASNSRRK